MRTDTPTISNSNYGTANTAYQLSSLAPGAHAGLSRYQKDWKLDPKAPTRGALEQMLLAQGSAAAPAPVKTVAHTPPKENPKMPTRRYVQVFIADPDESVPLESCMLYSGPPKLTDSTDQELFFEIDIRAVLDTHNAKRVTFKNKKAKDKDENLEPVRVRDLKMTVVTIAEF